MECTIFGALTGVTYQLRCPKGEGGAGGWGRRKTKKPREADNDLKCPYPDQIYFFDK